jgi:immune inhibitor A
VGAAIAALGAMALVAGPAHARAAHVRPAIDHQDDGFPPVSTRGAGPEHLENPLGDKRVARKQEAHAQLLAGDARPRTQNGSQVVELGDGEFAEVATTGTDRIFTVLVEFGDEAHPEFGGDRGPRANRIARPDRSVDNTTNWRPDFSRRHYEDLYFGQGQDQESVKRYFENQSSGRYSVEGRVSDWVAVDYNEARYGNTACGSAVCRSVWEVVADGVDAWYADQLARGLSHADIEAVLGEYDIKDRYDHDNDGDFNEPDGYLDHFQIVHAGEDASAGGGAQGDDAIWAHRWYAFYDRAARAGPAGNPAGGTRVGRTGFWVGDYTIQPENGGVGVFAHEFAHDLGLPDLYDTEGGENGTGFWTAMSSGSWLGLGDGTIGALPGELGPWEKLQLGWLDYDVTRAATNAVHRLGASGLEYPEGGRPWGHRQALVVTLPEKKVSTELVRPARGGTQWWSGSGNQLDSTLTRTVDLRHRSAAALEFTGWWDIEEDYDFLYVEVLDDGEWTAVDGTADGAVIGRDGVGRPALHGASGGHAALVYPLDAYAGRTVELRFRYATDTAIAQPGFTADGIGLVDGQALPPDTWTADGFAVVGAAVSAAHPQFYLVENRQFAGYDRTLENGPYNFGFAGQRPKWVEHFPYRRGMMVWLWDTSQPDNNTSAHPGAGLVLPVDAHAAPDRWDDGTLLRNRLQTRDATFGGRESPALTLHLNGEPVNLPARPGNPVFDDRHGTYWYPENPANSVRVPDTGTRITVLRERPADGAISVLVSRSR